MSARTKFEMTQSDLDTLMESMRTAPLIALQCGMPPSRQEMANLAWANLGKKMGFDGMTVEPISGCGPRYFTAIPVAKEEKPHLRMDGNQWCATNPDFIDLQQSPAGFGDTPELAIAALHADITKATGAQS